jgi:ubiquinone/menaquinone biosynthesis C-methylase UbiE
MIHTHTPFLCCTEYGWLAGGRSIWVLPDTYVTLISELYRILKTGGILYVSDFLLNSDRRNIDRYTAGNWKYKNFGVFKTEDGAILRHHSTEWIRQLLQNFTLNIYEELLFPTINNNQSNGFYSIGVKDA